MNSLFHRNHFKKNKRSKPLRIFGIISVYNESDIIEQTLAHMRAQRIPLIVIDNGSTDGTYQLLENEINKSVLFLKRIQTEKFELVFLLKNLYDSALKFKPDWLIRFDADEFLEPPSKYVDLREAIEEEAENIRREQM